MTCYHDSEDLKLVGELKQLAPAEFQGFVELDKIVGRDGAIPRKYRELMALAVAGRAGSSSCLPETRKIRAIAPVA